MSDKILKLNQAQTLYQDLRGRIDALPTNEDITVTDVQVNGTSILNNGVANIPYATQNAGGVVKIIESGTGGFQIDQGFLLISPAANTSIKMGSNSTLAPIVPGNQNMSVFYGLAKAAGADEKDSILPLGTYSDNAKTAINNMIGSVSKDSLDNAGISSLTYTTKFGGEFSVTTATETGWLNPHARASVTGRISKHYMHKVTFNGTEYILRTRLWYEEGSGGFKVYEYLGNLGLYIENITGVPGGTDNVPFIIISDLNNSSSIDIITQTAGTYTILVKQINPTKIDLPKSLIWEDSYVPIEKSKNGGTYNGFSLGVNELTNSRGTFAIGYGNKIEHEFSMAIGNSNQISGGSGIVIGDSNNISEGYGIAIGDYLNVNSFMIAVGKRNVAANTTFPDWANNTQYHKGDMVYAVWSSSSSATSPRFCWICAVDHISASSGTFYNNYSSNYWKFSPSTGDTAFVVGNGDSSVSLSNAMKVDWVGNAYLGGNVYVNANPDSTGGTKLATITDIPNVPVQDVQVNGTSIISNGVANIPIGTQNDLGVVRPNTYGGVTVNSNGQLLISKATENEIKAGTNIYKPITPNSIDMVTFYGLSKVAGVDLANETVTLGTYPETAKSAINEMLNGSITISGTTPTIVAKSGIRYVCGEVTSLNFMPSAAGICDVVFTSGSTVTVLTVPNTIKWPAWFDPTALEANVTYELNIMDGVYGAVGVWT